MPSGNKPKKKWPFWNGEQVVGRMSRRHFACIIQYPGDDNWYLVPRRIPPKKRCYEIIDALEKEGKLAPDAGS